MSTEEEKTPEPVYHESEHFVSAYFGKVPGHILGKTNSDEQLVSKVAVLLTDERNRELKEDLLNILRMHDARALLTGIITSKKYAKHRPVFIAACWETGLDFSEYLDLFVSILADPSCDYYSALEAMTVIEEMKSRFTDEVLLAHISKLKQPGSDNEVNKLRELTVKKLELMQALQ